MQYQRHSCSTDKERRSAWERSYHGSVEMGRRVSAQLLVKRGGKILHREGRTFDRKQAAAAWLEKRETELARPNALERIKATDPTLASVIDQYTEESNQADRPDEGAGTSSNQEV